MSLFSSNQRNTRRLVWLQCFSRQTVETWTPSKLFGQGCAKIWPCWNLRIWRTIKWSQWQVSRKGLRSCWDPIASQASLIFWLLIAFLFLFLFLLLLLFLALVPFSSSFVLLLTPIFNLNLIPTPEQSQGPGEQYCYLERLVRGMPARLAKCKKNNYGPCGK